MHVNENSESNKDYYLCPHYTETARTTNFSIVIHSCFELKLLALWKLRPYYSLLIFFMLASRCRVLGMLKYSTPDL